MGEVEALPVHLIIILEVQVHLKRRNNEFKNGDLSCLKRFFLLF
jgi:hypothetical protein